jgi:hypothetical protein
MVTFWEATGIEGEVVTWAKIRVKTKKKTIMNRIFISEKNLGIKLKRVTKPATLFNNCLSSNF